jgi:hypothetical protein
VQLHMILHLLLDAAGRCGRGSMVRRHGSRLAFRLGCCHRRNVSRRRAATFISVRSSLSRAATPWPSVDVVQRHRGCAGVGFRSGGWPLVCLCRIVVPGDVQTAVPSRVGRDARVLAGRYRVADGGRKGEKSDNSWRGLRVIVDRSLARSKATCTFCSPGRPCTGWCR